MSNLGKAAMIISVVAMLVLLVNETAWACEIVCCYKIVCKKGQPIRLLYEGIGKIVIGKGGVTITTVRPPPGWQSQLVPAGPPDLSGNELHLIPPQPLQEEGTWTFEFDSSDKEGTGFLWETREFRTRRILEVGYTTQD
jgi:hypothetical protein